MKKYSNSLYLCTACFAVLSSTTAFATDFDYLKFARETLLPCAHPTADISIANAEFIEAPGTDKDRSSAQVNISYKGWLKQNAMQVKIVLRQCCDDAYLVKAELIDDTAGTGTMVCKYFSGGWFDVEAEPPKPAPKAVPKADPDEKKLDDEKYIKLKRL